MHFKGLKMFHIKAQKYSTPVSTKVTTHTTPTIPYIAGMNPSFIKIN
jgi:hypothetical protein